MTWQWTNLLQLKSDNKGASIALAIKYITKADNSAGKPRINLPMSFVSNNQLNRPYHNFDLDNKDFGHSGKIKVL